MPHIVKIPIVTANVYLPTKEAAVAYARNTGGVIQSGGTDDVVLYRCNPMCDLCLLIAKDKQL